MSTPPSELPGPPPAQPSATPTQITGQQVAPTSSVPVAPQGVTYAPAQGRTSSLAIVSLVAGAVSIFGHIVLPGIGGGTIALVAIVTGFMARSQIRQSGEQGMWMATLGIILGIVHFAILVLLLIALVVLVFVFGLALFGWHR